MKIVSCFYLSVVTFMGLLFSCNERNTMPANKISSADFAGKVYKYAPEIDSINLGVTGGCDCCSGDLLFLDDSNFVLIDYCEADAQIFKGKYVVNSQNKLVFSYDKLAVSKSYNLEKEIDTTAQPEFFIESKTFNPKSDTFTSFIFKETLFLVFGTDVKYFVTADKEVKITDAIRELKNDGIWAKLMNE